jgi:hypothetical protein
MRHDYDFPQCWDTLTPEQKDTWYKGERARRQALRQDTVVARRARELHRRRQRKAEARADTVSLEDWR